MPEKHLGNDGTIKDFSKYRHVFCDIDHTIATFIEKRFEIPTLVVESINNLRPGVGFSITTARCLEEVLEIGGIANIRFRSPLILENGASILTPELNIVSQYQLDGDVVTQLMEYLGTFDIWKKVVIGGKLHNFDSITNESRTTKIGLQDLTESMMENILEKLSCFSDISYFRSKAAHKPGTFTLDITNSHATKYNGVFEVLRILEIKRDLVIGIGDSDNDFPMLDACGLKVAVANAKPSILEMAELIIPDCESGGVAQLLPLLGK